MTTVGSIPAELTSMDQWANWEERPNRSGKETKVPMTITGRPASSTDPTTWESYERARARSEKLVFALTDADPYVVVDLDGLTWEDARTQYIVAHFPPTYTERSPSGWAHLWVRGPSGKKRQMKSAEGWGIDVLSQRHFVTVTGDTLGDCGEIADGTAGLVWLLRDYFGDTGQGGNATGEEWRAIDVVLHPGAQPPPADFLRLSIAQKDFAAVWERRRAMPHDQSGSAYMLSIANTLVREGWDHQAICDTLVAFREKHHLDPKRLDVYQRTIYTAIHQANRGDALGHLSLAATVSGDGTRAIISQLTHLEVVRYVQVGNAPASYRLHLTTGAPIILGNAEKARSQTTWQTIAQEVTGAPFKTLTPTQWHQFLVALGQIVEREEEDTASDLDDHLDMLRHYAAQAAAQEGTYETVKMTNPFTEDDALFLSINHLQHWTRMLRAPVATAELRNVLRLLGGVNQQVSRRDGPGQHVSRRYWRVELSAVMERF